LLSFYILVIQTSRQALGDKVFSGLAGDVKQKAPAAAGNGNDGYFIAWQDVSNGDWDVYGSPF
jgi:hypothetical protein